MVVSCGWSYHGIICMVTWYCHVTVITLSRVCVCVCVTIVALVLLWAMYDHMILPCDYMYNHMILLCLSRQWSSGLDIVQECEPGIEMIPSIAYHCAIFCMPYRCCCCWGQTIV